MALSTVDLPAPLVPSSARISPLRTSRSTPNSTFTPSYATETPWQVSRTPDSSSWIRSRRTRVTSARVSSADWVSPATNRLAVAITMPPMTQYGAVAASPTRMPWWSATADTGRIRNSTQTPASRNNADHANDSDRTRAGETNACVVTNGGGKMPPTKLGTGLIATTAERVGSAQITTMPKPTPTSEMPAHLIGSPRSRWIQRRVHRPD